MGGSTCMKCGNGGNVLVCMNSKCPLAVHESCIPGSLQAHHREKFCCPYCLYKQSAAECSQAKDKALLARRNLSLFLGAKVYVNKEHEPSVTPDNCTNHEELGNEDRLMENEMAETDPKKGECSLDHVRGMLSDEQASLLTPDKNCGGQICDRRLSKLETVDSVNGCKERTTSLEYPFTTPMPLAVVGGEMVQFHQPIHNSAYENQKFGKNQQHPEPLDGCNIDKGMELEPIVCNVGDRNRIGRLAEMDLLQRKNKRRREAGPIETAIFSISGEGNRAEIYEESDIRSETCTSCNCNDSAAVYATVARKSIQNAIQPKKSSHNAIESKNYTPTGQVSDKSYEDEDVDEDDGCKCNDPNTVTADNAGWNEKPKKEICSLNDASDARRKRLMWTTEEEEMLKKGVVVFSSGVKKNLPWRKILAFGSHVFARSRTPLDLQSKWKMMSRKEHLKLNSKCEAAIDSDDF